MSGHSSCNTDNAMFKASEHGHYIFGHNIDKGSEHDLYITELTIVSCLDMAPVLLIITCPRPVNIDTKFLDIL